jgi:hypothetical protein
VGFPPTGKTFFHWIRRRKLAFNRSITSPEQEISAKQFLAVNLPGAFDMVTRKPFQNICPTRGKLCKGLYDCVVFKDKFFISEFFTASPKFDYLLHPSKSQAQSSVPTDHGFI